MFDPTIGRIYSVSFVHGIWIQMYVLLREAAISETSDPLLARKMHRAPEGQESGDVCSCIGWKAFPVGSICRAPISGSEGVS